MHYVFTDLHGDLELWKRITDKYIKPENELIFLGDACDRGRHGYQIMKEMLATPNLVYLKGNHEDMFCKAAREIVRWRNKCRYTIEEVQQMETYEIAPYGRDMNLSCQNGGITTIWAWVKDGMPLDIVERLEQLPVWHQWAEYDFCHAGCKIHEWDEVRLSNPGLFAEIALWSRDHFYSGCNWYEDRVLVHGHTRTQSHSFYSLILKPELTKRRGHPVRYANNTKINMDTGSWAEPFGWVMCLETGEFERIEK